MWKGEVRTLYKNVLLYKLPTQTLVNKILRGGHPYHRSSHHTLLTSIHFRLLLYLAAGFKNIFLKENSVNLHFFSTTTQPNNQETGKQYKATGLTNMQLSWTGGTNGQAPYDRVQPIPTQSSHSTAHLILKHHINTVSVSSSISNILHSLQE